MNISKHTNLTKIVLTLSLALVVICSSMTVARSQDLILTSKADYYANYDDNLQSWISTPQQWSQYDNKTIIRRFTTTYSSLGYYQMKNFVLSCESTNNYELEYSMILWNYYNQKFFESAWYDNNTIINAPQMSDQWNSSDYDNFATNPNHINWVFEVWVRRKDGGDLSRQDMLPCSFAFDRGFRQTVVQTTAIPQNWLETTTQSIPTYTTQTTMVTTVDYESYLSTLTVPADVRPAIATLDQLINDLWSLHYIPFVVCFALIMGLAIWLLH